ncbi:MAG: class I SAM-dependent methyltransferase [Oscillospiraceae bacterium]|nr:class I SAM-dependent methyltransferase [Oscillospiraceae bacterium]
MGSLAGYEWTFNTVAGLYERMRPGYVPELYDDVFRYLPIGEGSRALEIGIGGGQATFPVLQTGCSVTAVEYGEQLAQLCREKFREFPGFSAVTARFEDFEGEPDSYDLIYSASAFHWIPEEIGYPKVLSLLKKGGAFARFANHPYQDKGRPGLTEAIQRAYAVYMPGSHAPMEWTRECAQERADLAARYGFVETECHLYHRTRTFTAQEYTQLLGTYSDHIALGEEVCKRFFAEIEEAINSFGGEITLYDTIDLQLARKA